MTTSDRPDHPVSGMRERVSDEVTRWQDSFAPFTDRELLIMANTAKGWRTELERVKALSEEERADWHEAAQELAALRTELTSLRADPCVHSMVRDDCLSCQKGVVERLNTELTSLRALVREMYDEWMPDFWEQAPTPRQSLLHKRAAALGCLAEAPDDHPEEQSNGE